MFLIHINDPIDLLACYNITVKLFADDGKLYAKIVNNVDITVLYEHLHVHFADEWQLYVSVDECGVLYVGKDAVILLSHNFY